MIGEREYSQELAHLPALKTTSIQDNQLHQQRVQELEEHNKEQNLSKRVQELVKALEELTKLERPKESHLPKLQDKLRSDNDERVEELEEHANLHKWLRELQNACKSLRKSSTSQLRACQKVRPQLTLAKRDRTDNDKDNELEKNFDNKQNLQTSLKKASYNF